jgi:hypothetical protein
VGTTGAAADGVAVPLGDADLDGVGLTDALAEPEALPDALAVALLEAEGEALDDVPELADAADDDGLASVITTEGSAPARADSVRTSGTVTAVRTWYKPVLAGAHAVITWMSGCLVEDRRSTCRWVHQLPSCPLGDTDRYCTSAISGRCRRPGCVVTAMA